MTHSPDCEFCDPEGEPMRRLDAGSTMLEVISAERNRLYDRVLELERLLNDYRDTKSLALELHARMEDAYEKAVTERDFFKSFADSFAELCKDSELFRQYAEFLFSRRSSGVGPV